MPCAPHKIYDVCFSRYKDGRGVSEREKKLDKKLRRYIQGSSEILILDSVHTMDKDTKTHDFKACSHPWPYAKMIYGINENVNLNKTPLPSGPGV